MGALDRVVSQGALGHSDDALAIVIQPAAGSVRRVAQHLGVGEHQRAAVEHRAAVADSVVVHQDAVLQRQVAARVVEYGRAGLVEKSAVGCLAVLQAQAGDDHCAPHHEGAALRAGVYDGALRSSAGEGQLSTERNVVLVVGASGDTDGVAIGGFAHRRADGGAGRGRRQAVVAVVAGGGVDVPGGGRRRGQRRRATGQPE